MSLLELRGVPGTAECLRTFSEIAARAGIILDSQSCARGG